MQKCSPWRLLLFPQVLAGLLLDGGDEALPDWQVSCTDGL